MRRPHVLATPPALIRKVTDTKDRALWPSAGGAGRFRLRKPRHANVCNRRGIWRRALVAATAVLGLAVLVAGTARAQMVTGEKIPNFGKTFGVTVGERNYPYSVQLIESSVPGNVLFPDDKPTFKFQIVNDTDAAIQGHAKIDVVAYGTKGDPGEIWIPDMFKIGDAGSVPIDVNVPAHGYQDVSVTPDIPARFGAYALITDLGGMDTDLGKGARRFLTTMVRTFPATTERIQYPSFCLDQLPQTVLRRLGVQAIRMGIEYVPTTDKSYPEWRDKLRARLAQLKANNITVLAMVMGGPATQPLGRPRPHLDADGVMLTTKSDMAWMPEKDPDFSKWCADIAGEQGWPKGPITCFSLWNEPWEGISISGWGADNLRYREIFTAMAQGVDSARHDSNVDVLIGGCDSSTNTEDKLFADSLDNVFTKWLDVCTIHYQGMDSRSNLYSWATRKGPHGRVKIWDTESWVANVDDRVAAVVAGDRSAGYDRAMGVYGGNVCWEQEGRKRLPGGGSEPIRAVHMWSPAASIGATQHFIGERKFHELLFNGLPWVMRFDGRTGADDGTLVVVGDIGEEFGHDALLFRTVRSLADRKRIDALKVQLAALPADAPGRAAIEKAIATSVTRTGCSMTLPADPAYALYDFYGNVVPAENNAITVPLDGRGFFLRPSGEKGSFAKLLAAVKVSHIDGLEPVQIAPKDLLAPLASHPAFHVNLTNILNRPVTGHLTATAQGISFAPGQTVTLAPNESRDMEIAVTDAKPSPDNRYPLNAVFDAGADGKSELDDEVRVNLIARRTINVDGNLDDWKGVLPQTIQSSGSNAPTLTEAAWFPFAKYDKTIRKGFATGYLAADDKNFYFATRVADETPDEGMLRYENRDNDADFYPATAYEVDASKTLKRREAVWETPAVLPFALQSAGGAAATGVTVWESTSKSFAIDLKLPEGAPKQVAFYLLDNDPLSRRQTHIEVRDAISGKVLLRHVVSRFDRGSYAVFGLSGNVRVVFTTNNFLSAAVAGVFFDPAPQGARLTAFRQGPTAQFVRVDESTEGKWEGVYGSDGSEVFGAAAKLPAYATLTVPEIEEKKTMTWPSGVRRYSYRQKPEIPAGNAPNHDNVQIAFNVIPYADAATKGTFAAMSGTPEHYTGYRDTDYEYALNPVAPKYGGGTEIWRLLVPGMPRKSFYPRQAVSPFDGPVKSGKLVIRQDGNTRIVECSIPWSELPEVKKTLDAGKSIKFTFRVNDNAGVGCLELTRGRAVARRNSQTFHADWIEHWSNEVEFALEK